MSALLEVLDVGFANCIQDAGRFGHRSIGVPVAGAADPVLLACANHLLGNEADTAGLEITLAGPRLKALAGPLRCALAGRLAARLSRADGTTAEVPPWHTATLFPGDTIALGAARGTAYLALSGGFQVSPQLGSRATYARARLGGVDGRALQCGDRIACGQLESDPWQEFRARPFHHEDGPLRVIPGPQDDHFLPEALHAFFDQAFTVGREMDRMGIRMTGPRLAHRPECGADIVSDGVTPGAIQVPADGQPILLGPDCQTVGGYPKIATVIGADLPRLAQLSPGQQIRFAAVSLDEARRARVRQHEALQRWRAAIEGFRPPGVVDEAALYAANLLSGMVDARSFDGSDDLELPWERE